MSSTRAKLFKCRECPAAFRDQGNFSRHRKLHGDPTSEIYIPGYIDYRYSKYNDQSCLPDTVSTKMEKKRRAEKKDAKSSARVGVKKELIVRTPMDQPLPSTSTSSFQLFFPSPSPTPSLTTRNSGSPAPSLDSDDQHFILGTVKAEHFPCDQQYQNVSTCSFNDNPGMWVPPSIYQEEPPHQDEFALDPVSYNVYPDASPIDFSAPSYSYPVNTYIPSSSHVDQYTNVDDLMMYEVDWEAMKPFNAFI